MTFTIIGGLPYYVAPDGTVFTVSLGDRSFTIGPRTNKKPAGLLSEASVRAKAGNASSIPARTDRKRGKPHADDT